LGAPEKGPIFFVFDYRMFLLIGTRCTSGNEALHAAQKSVGKAAKRTQIQTQKERQITEKTCFKAD